MGSGAGTLGIRLIRDSILRPMILDSYLFMFYIDVISLECDVPNVEFRATFREKFIFDRRDVASLKRGVLTENFERFVPV